MKQIRTDLQSYRFLHDPLEKLKGQRFWDTISRCSEQLQLVKSVEVRRQKHGNTNPTTLLFDEIGLLQSSRAHTNKENGITKPNTEIHFKQCRRIARLFC